MYWHPSLKKKKKKERNETPAKTEKTEKKKINKLKVIDYMFVFHPIENLSFWDVTIAVEPNMFST
jgi:hypothetical protein